MQWRWVAAMGVIACAGCHRASGPPVVILRVGTWGNPADEGEFAQKLQAIYRRFEELHPGVKIEAETAARDYVSKMVLDDLADVSPDVMMLDGSSAALFINNGLVRDLTPLIRQTPTFHLNDFYPAAVRIAARGQALYAIPQDFTPMVVYYNKAIFNERHVPYPTGNWNFSTFAKVAQSVTFQSAGSPIYGFAFKNWAPGWLMWFWNNGGDALSADGTRAEGFLNSPENAQVLGYFKYLVQTLHVAPSLSAQNAMGVDPFSNGQAAMTISGHWSMIDYKQAPVDSKTGKPALDWTRLGIAELPHNTPQSHTVAYESGFAIPTKARRPDLAWEFIQYMTSHDVQLEYNQSGIAIDGRMDVAKERAQDPLEKAFLKLIPGSRPPFGSYVQSFPFVETQCENSLEAVLQDGANPIEALTTAAKRIDMEFAKK